METCSTLSFYLGNTNVPWGSSSIRQQWRWSDPQEVRP